MASRLGSAISAVSDRSGSHSDHTRCRVAGLGPRRSAGLHWVSYFPVCGFVVFCRSCYAERGTAVHFASFCTHSVSCLRHHSQLVREHSVGCEGATLPSRRVSPIHSGNHTFRLDLSMPDVGVLAGRQFFLEVAVESLFGDNPSIF